MAYLPAQMTFSPPSSHARDPLPWLLAITAAFFALALHRLAIPSKPMFDEIHYLPAARRLIDLTRRFNPEHPLLAKEMISLGMRAFGDGPFGWRFPSAVLGTVGLFAAARAVWWASGSRAATLLFALLLATDFVWFILSRIAMLDMTMLAMMALAFWQWALAWRKGSRLDLILCGLFMGLSLGAKWNGAPLLVAPGLLFAWDRWQALGRGERGRVLIARGAGPVPGVSLIEAGVWLGLWPVVVYLATFAPAFFYQVQPMTLRGLIPWQGYMLQLQDSVVKPHTYMSRWWQWVLDIRPIWFLYENIDGAQRGVLMLGNPFTMLAGLPALALCAWDGLKGDRLRRGVALLYALALVFWATNGKPVQFYYHYALASMFLVAALALVLARWWETGRRWPVRASVGLALVLFMGFYPILSAAALPRANSYVDWMWLRSWR